MTRQQIFLRKRAKILLPLVLFLAKYPKLVCGTAIAFNRE